MRVLKKIKEYFDRYFLNRCVVYYYKKSLVELTSVPQNTEVKKATDFEQLINNNLSIDAGLSRVFKERFSNNEEMYYCADNSRIISYGFKQKNVLEFYAWEIAAKIVFAQNVTMLYDFWVDEDFRGRGIYKSMLAKIQNDAEDDEVLVIFAMNSNRISCRGIERSNFSYVTEVSRLHPKVEQKL